MISADIEHGEYTLYALNVSDSRLVNKPKTRAYLTKFT